MVASTDKLPISGKQADKLMKARCRLLTREPFYGHIAMNMVWIPSEMTWKPEYSRTMGVRIVNGGEIQCLYYPKFVDSMTVHELFAVIQHEIEHIVRCHCIRIGSRNPEASNIAADMCVNGPKARPRIGYQEPTSGKLIVPLEGNIVWIPETWPQDGTYEVYYDMLEKKQREIGAICGNCGRPSKNGKNGKNGGGKSGKDGKDGKDGSCPTCGNNTNDSYEYGGVSGKSIDDHSTWNQSDVSPDEARQIVKDIVDQAVSKCQGNIPGHLSEIIANLNKPVVRWRELLRQYLGKHAGNQRRTYSRPNRRRQQFGSKGVSHHAASDVTVIVDTSGSIDQKELQQFFAEIESISHKSRVWLLQWDHEFQGYSRYRRNDWKKMKINGRGGTDMAKPIEWLCDNNLIKDVQVMLTDGYCNYAAKKNFPYICVITTPQGTTDGPTWGHTIRMKVDGT